MNLKKSFLVISCFAVLLTLSSAEWQGRPRKNNSKITEQNGIVKVGGAEAMAMTVRAYDVKVGNKYKITGAVRIPKGKQRFYFGMMCYDKNGKQIQGGEAVPVLGTETELVKAVKAGDRVILVKDASKWRKSGGTSVAFNVKKGYADLPNRDLSRGPVTHIEKAADGKNWEITLRLPFRKDYPAGTRIRQQAGSAYVYLLSGINVNDQWQNIAVTADCTLMSPANKFKKGLFPGTHKIRFIALIQGPRAEFELKNLEIK